jgi:hypothetical protein
MPVQEKYAFMACLQLWSAMPGDVSTSGEVHDDFRRRMVPLIHTLYLYHSLAPLGVVLTEPPAGQWPS